MWGRQAACRCAAADGGRCPKGPLFWAGTTFVREHNEASS